MGSPLTLTAANCYIFFFEQHIVKLMYNNNGLYRRYIDDTIIVINWTKEQLIQEIEEWNKIDPNIKLIATIGSQADFLDLHIENKNGHIETSVFHKPSYEPYYLPFNSVHPLHMKRNIPFAALIRAIRYSSSFQAFIDEREKIRMALLLNKYPSEFIDDQFNRVSSTFKLKPLNPNNYLQERERLLDSQKTDKPTIDFTTTMFVHFTYCSSMRHFPTKFHSLWQKYFGQSPISDIRPIIGTRNVGNLQRRMAHTRDQ